MKDETKETLKNVAGGILALAVIAVFVIASGTVPTESRLEMIDETGDLNFDKKRW